MYGQDAGQRRLGNDLLYPTISPEGQARLDHLEGLALRLIIGVEHQRAFPRGREDQDNIPQLLLELLIGRDLESSCAMPLEYPATPGLCENVSEETLTTAAVLHVFQRWWSGGAWLAAHASSAVT